MEAMTNILHWTTATDLDTQGDNLDYDTRPVGIDLGLPAALHLRRMQQ
jgi:hypothetical protein